MLQQRVFVRVTPPSPVRRRHQELRYLGQRAQRPYPVTRRHHRVVFAFERAQRPYPVTRLYRRRLHSSLLLLALYLVRQQRHPLRYYEPLQPLLCQVRLQFLQRQFEYARVQALYQVRVRLLDQQSESRTNQHLFQVRRLSLHLRYVSGIQAPPLLVQQPYQQPQFASGMGQAVSAGTLLSLAQQCGCVMKAHLYRVQQQLRQLVSVSKS